MTSRLLSVLTGLMFVAGAATAATGDRDAAMSDDAEMTDGASTVDRDLALGYADGAGAGKADALAMSGSADPERASDGSLPLKVPAEPRDEESYAKGWYLGYTDAFTFTINSGTYDGAR